MESNQIVLANVQSESSDKIGSDYERVLWGVWADDEITSDTSFPFVYFYSIVRIGIMRCYHPRWTRKSNNIIMNNMQTLY